MQLQKIFIILTVGLICASCQQPVVKKNKEQLKAEVIKAEIDFSNMASARGIAAAFYEFADSNATIKRGNDSLIHGRDAIRHFYSDSSYLKASLKWAPDFVEISEDGTLAYTYGKYTWKSANSPHETGQFTGVFHSVWKRQADGSWKYVWD